MLSKNIFERLRYELTSQLRKPFQARDEHRAKRYLEKAGALTVLQTNDPNEHPTVYSDLAYLHRTARRLRPRTIVEFGVGFSTLVFAHALQANAADRPNEEPGRLHTVDTSEYWLENTRTKLACGLGDVVDLQFSDARLTTINGELCHLFDRLPNVVPDLIYVDGPASASVQGEVHGLTSLVDRGLRRKAVTADALLYESGLRIGATVIVDTRTINTRFLRRNLKRKWRFSGNRVDGRFTFVLVD